MNRHSTGIKALACGLVAAVTLSFAHAANERGKELFVNCQACHGPDAEGNKLLNAPSLAGLSAKYIEAEYHKFKNHIRGNDPRDTTGLQMAPMALVLQSDDDITAVAEYVATLPAKVKEPTLAGGDPERGKAYFATCQACHGPDAAGNDALSAPALKYQYDWYLDRQLRNFKQGIRGADPKDITGGQMRPMAMTLPDDQAIKDVVAYIHTLATK